MALATSTARCSSASREALASPPGSAASAAPPASARPSSRTGAGFRFNSPNDVTVTSDGAIWFTDPCYGHLQGFKPEPAVGDYVYRHDPARGKMTVVADGFDKPNGIALSPDERVLYVTDSGANQEPGSYYVDRPHHIKAFDVIDRRRLAGERLFAVTSPGFPDGLKVDSDGPRLRVLFLRRSGLRRGGRPARRDPRPGRRQLLLRRARTQPAADHDRHGRLGGDTRRERSLTNMSSLTHRIIDEAGAQAVLDAAERDALDHGHRVVIAVVDRSGELVEPAAHTRRPGRELARRARQGPYRGDLRPPEPRARAAGQRRAPRRTRAARRPRPDGRHPAEGRRRGRRRDRDQRRDPRRRRGRLDRRRGRASSRRATVPALTSADARRAAEAVAAECGRRGVAPVCAVVDAGAISSTSGDRTAPGRERRRRHRQGAHGGDLPPAEQGLRGAGVRRPRLGAPPRARRAAPGRHPDRPRRPRHRRGRRQRRLLRGRGPGARRARSRRARRRARLAATGLRSSTQRRSQPSSPPAVCCSTPAPTSSTPAGVKRPARSSTTLTPST